ncbi:styrene monooxygenase/indole monooxygenase family protein [Kitasatospora sp. NBC_00458]|uniref:styrene monooxygenase/indole monooxygenase family protein n=1 Tax=Kitasatospora sp. NBC_00458 TaxID=2903568 RepID=UPI002E18632C
MRGIAIVGAGQAGLQLALGLLALGGYRVTVVSARTPEQLLAGPVLSTQAMFGPALRIERSAGLDLWAGAAPAVRDVDAVLVPEPGVRALEFTMTLDEPAQSVDQRLKMARWLELVAERGGRVEYRSLDRAGLRELAAANELTVVAVGRGGLAGIFERDAARSPFDAPQRTLAALYAHGVGAPDPSAGPRARMHAVPGVGELYLQPALTLSGPCDILLWEAVPGSPFDCFADRPDPDEQLRRMRESLRTYLPWEAELWEAAEPTDAGASLYGALTPEVRRPVARLDGGSGGSGGSGGGGAAAGGADGPAVLGIGDALVVNDPITGQGANSAARAAAAYLVAIVARRGEPFTTEWMHDTFERFWHRHARHTVEFTASMLTMPDHLQAVFGAAAEHPAVARRLANTYAEPIDYAAWLASPELTEEYLATVRSAAPGAGPVPDGPLP